MKSILFNNEMIQRNLIFNHMDKLKIERMTLKTANTESMAICNLERASIRKPK